MSIHGNTTPTSLTDLRIVQVIIRAYLVGFLMVGCIPRPEPVSVEQARAMETRMVYASQVQVMRAAITTLQDMRYSIEVADSELGIIVASIQTEGKQVAITEEPDTAEDELTTGQKIFIVAAIVAVIVAIAAIFGGGGGDDDDDGPYTDDDGDYHSPWWPWGRGRDRDNGARVFEYRLNINVTAIDSSSVSVRVSGSGKSARGRTVAEVGAIEDPLFFDRFFTRLGEALQRAQY